MIRKKLKLIIGLFGIGLLAAGNVNAEAYMHPPLLQALMGISSIEQFPLYRTRLKIKTCDKRHAGTDDKVYVRMNNRQEAYYLDYGRNDFERNQEKHYDIFTKNLTKVSDIDYLQIGLMGNDGICIKSIKLLINENQEIFSKTYPDGKWLDNHNSNASNNLVITHNALRQDSRWDSSVTYLAQLKKLSDDAFENMMEGMVGDAISISELKWGHKKGGEFVDAKRYNRNTFLVDLDLRTDVSEADAWGYFDYVASFSVDVDLKMNLTCEDHKFSITPRLKSVTVKRESGNFLSALEDLFKDEVEREVANEVFEKIRTNLLSKKIIIPTKRCPSDILIDVNNDLNLIP